MNLKTATCNTPGRPKVNVHITPLTKFRPENVESKDHIQKISGIGLGV